MNACLCWNSPSAPVCRTSSVSKQFCPFVASKRLAPTWVPLNGKSVKPLQLWHLPGFDFENLARPRPDHNAFIGLVSRGEDGRFTGMSADVQASGEYTSMFGEAVAQIVRNLL